jgi:hypothetical protein
MPPHREQQRRLDAPSSCAGVTDMQTVHDNYCRCRICKPPLVGEAHKRANRLLIALLIAAVIAAIMGFLS